jgi:cobalt-zinc-cadmium efflux system membrane fusion protein
MTGERRLSFGPGAAASGALAVLLVGAGGTYLVMRDRPASSSNTPSGPGRQPAISQTQTPGGLSSRPAAASNDVVVTLTKEGLDRAGIAVTPVTTQGVAEGLRLPGVVEPNAYRQVSITPLVSGRVVTVSAQLGDRVRRGQSVAEIYSPEIAEARTKYVAARSMLDAHERELQRTEKLVEIGAASRQELERIHAEHAAQTAEVESARSRLQLLGADAEVSAGKPEASATTSVPAPIDGVVTERLANVGLNVDPSTKLFAIVDLSNVWIIADVYEKDLHRIREGDRATVTMNAFPDRSLEGRVSYIDPQLNSSTRTAKVRVAVPNPTGDLRFGMYAEVVMASAATASALAVPKTAIQNVGDHEVVYLPVANETGKFIERQVRVGHSSGDLVEVLSGLTALDSVVSKGSFYLRAEVERLGLRSGAPADAQTAKVAVTENGFEPETVRLRAGVPAQLTFIRTTDKTCGTEVVFPSLNLKRALPLNQPVLIEFTPEKNGDIAFACGMDMLKGVVVVD